MQIELSSGTTAFFRRPAAVASDFGVVPATDIFGLGPGFEELTAPLADFVPAARLSDSPAA